MDDAQHWLRKFRSFVSQLIITIDDFANCLLKHLQIKTILLVTYLGSARLAGSNSTNNIEILQKLTMLQPFYGNRNILEIRAKSSRFSHIFDVFDFRSKQQIHIWYLHNWLVLTVPITLKYSKNVPFKSHFIELESSWIYVRNRLCFLINFSYLTSPNSKYIFGICMIDWF